MRQRSTTEIGFINPNDQANLGTLGIPGTDHNQRLYKMRCLKCSAVYAANGSDIHHRLCPFCQGGNPSSGGWQERTVADLHPASSEE